MSRAALTGGMYTSGSIEVHRDAGPVAAASGTLSPPMHSSTELDRSSFAVTVDDAPATIDDLFPAFSEHDRLGVVVREPCGAVGSSCLLLAAVTAFYDLQRARGTDFFIYPDYFLFHVGRRLGDHSMLDVWPEHKEVVVADEPEEILRAVNDRAITRLVVDDGASAEVGDGAPGQVGASAPAQAGAGAPLDVLFGRETLASARGRIAGAFAYSPSGRVADANVRVAGNDVTESYVNAVLDPAGLSETAAEPYASAVASRANEVTDDVRAEIRARRTGLRDDGRPLETYRRLTLEQALALLGSHSPPPA
jgi:hypothetical protein